MWWGFEKFRIHKFAKQYQRTLYLDVDVVLTSKTPNLFDVLPADKVSMHDDFPYQINHDWHEIERKIVYKSQHIYYKQLNVLYNSGIVMCNINQADVWKPPFGELPTVHCAEQFWVEYNALQFPIFDMPIELNTQYWMPDFYNLLHKASIIHLANCNHVQRLNMAKQMIQW